ncbi:MAG TPA: hypothetical protein VGL99_25215 [Chloroflexota bacterium]
MYWTSAIVQHINDDVLDTIFENADPCPCGRILVLEMGQPIATTL